jgi:hypothetical protein
MSGGFSILRGLERILCPHGAWHVQMGLRCIGEMNARGDDWEVEDLGDGRIRLWLFAPRAVARGRGCDGAASCRNLSSANHLTPGTSQPDAVSERRRIARGGGKHRLAK